MEEMENKKILWYHKFLEDSGLLLKQLKMKQTNKGVDSLVCY